MSILTTIVDAVTPSKKEDGNLDAIDLLRDDHKVVDKLFKEYEALVDEGTDIGDRRTLSTQVCALLAVHAIIEEEIFYPAARDAGVNASLLDEAAVEHGAVKELIAHIGASDTFDSVYDARIKVLGEYVRHHVKEEEGELFPACRKNQMDFGDLGARLKKRQDELMRLLTRGKAQASKSPL